MYEFVFLHVEIMKINGNVWKFGVWSPGLETCFSFCFNVFLMN